VTTTPAAESPRLADVSVPVIASALEGAGLWLDIGAITLRARSDCPLFARQLRATYPEFPFQGAGEWADIHVDILRAGGTRRWIRPQVILRCDGRQPFEPFPADTPLPMFEWGCNWTIGQRLNDLLLLHAGALERDGFALLLPATPGSGKSTLTAALSTRGWRLLSDEFGAFDPHACEFRAMLKPVALKNQSIAVIREFAPGAVFGPEFPKTRKGTVAHLAASPEAVARRHDNARPGAVVLPKWEAGSATRLEPLEDHSLFSSLAFNAFNYATLGEVGFRAAVTLVRTCPGWHLVYSDLEDAIARLDALWPEVVARGRERN
jgi:HprK-related kinase A